MHSSTDAALRAALGPVVELDDALAAKEGQLRTELESVRIERQKLAKVLRALNPERPRMGPRPGSESGRNAPYAVSEEVVETVRAVIATFDDDEFAASRVWALAGLSGSDSNQKDKINKAIARLRERGQVRLVSTKRGRHGGHVYVATPRIGEQPVEIAAESNGA